MYLEVIISMYLEVTFCLLMFYAILFGSEKNMLCDFNLS